MSGRKRFAMKEREKLARAIPKEPGSGTICFHPKHTRRSEAGLLTRRSLRRRLPSRSTQWHSAGRSLLTVAGPCGILTRFPFHSIPTGEHLGSPQRSMG